MNVHTKSASNDTLEMTVLLVLFKLDHFYFETFIVIMCMC